MRAIILAAGKSTRLGNLTKDIPKPMLIVKGKPILEHNILYLKEYGIKDIYINLHYLPDVIKNYFRDGSKWGVTITYSYEEEILGTAGGVKKIASELWNEIGQFIVLYGDNYYEYDLQELIIFHEKKKGIITVGLYEKQGDLSQSGVAVLDNDGRILEFIEKPTFRVISKLVNTGIYICEPKVIDYIPFGFSDFGKDILPSLIKKEKVFGYVLKGNLIAIDTPDLLKSANAKFNSGGKNDYYKNTF